jgi:hypothetical protein
MEIKPVIKIRSYYQQTLYFVANKKLDWDQREIIANLIMKQVSPREEDTDIKILRYCLKGDRIWITYKVYPFRIYYKQRVVIELTDTSLVLLHLVASADWYGECSFAATDEKFRRGDSLNNANVK